MWFNDLMAEVHATPQLAGLFYGAIAVLLVLPMRFASKVIERIPVDWLDRTSSPAVVTIIGFLTCWFVLRWLPQFNAAQLYQAVLGGGLTSVVHRKISEPVGKAAGVAMDKVGGVSTGEAEGGN